METLATRPSPPLVEARLKRDLLASVLTGQIAGLIMAVVIVLVFTVILGTTPWFPVQVIGSFVFGDQALVGFQPPAFVVGLLLHQLGPSVIWAVAFGLVINKHDLRGVNLIVLGLAIGVFSQVVDVVLLMPPLMNAPHGHNLWNENVPRVWSWAAHLVFGLGFLLFPQIRDRLPAGAAH